MGIAKKITLFSTAVVLANVFYLIRKKYGKEKSRDLLRRLRFFINVLPVEEKIVDMVLSSKFSDCEDGLQYFASKENHISILVTRNGRDYKEKDVIIQNPEEYLESRR